MSNGGLNWPAIMDSIPSRCSRNHETVEMINYNRRTIRNVGGSDRRLDVLLQFFCPSCHQKIQIKAKKIGENRFAPTSIEVLEEGQL